MQMRMLLVEEQSAAVRWIRSTIRAADETARDSTDEPRGNELGWSVQEIHDGEHGGAAFLRELRASLPVQSRDQVRGLADHRILPILFVASRLDAHSEILDFARESASANEVERVETRALGFNEAVLRDDGEFWTVTYANETHRLRAMKGFRYIASLVRQERRPLFAVDLVANHSGRTDSSRGGSCSRNEGLRVVSDLGNSGEALDARAAREYGQRLDDLRLELMELEDQREDATTLNDLGRQEAVRDRIELLLDERDFIARQLAGNRSTASHRERARQIVTKNIKSALKKITAKLPALGHHLSTHIRTGGMCLYSPDVERPIRWMV